MFKRKSKKERYYKKAMKDIKKIERKIEKAEYHGENYLELNSLFILKNEWSSNVFRESVELVLNHFKEKGYTIKIPYGYNCYYNCLKIRLNS